MKTVKEYVDQYVSSTEAPGGASGIKIMTYVQLLKDLLLEVKEIGLAMPHAPCNEEVEEIIRGQHKKFLEIRELLEIPQIRTDSLIVVLKEGMPGFWDVFKHRIVDLMEPDLRELEGL